jgi:MOSC domain-containing protein YiiM
MQELERTELTVERGVADDLRGRVGRRQVTVLTREGWERACRQLGEAELPWTLRRANLLVEGVELRESTGAELRIGAALLKITGETDPCPRMDAQLQGLTAALVPDWRGGATCRVRMSGIIELGDEVVLEPGKG